MSKKKHPEHVNHERWLVSYADFITLLFAFFVVLFASGQSDKRKTVKLAQAMQTAFTHNGIFDPHSRTPPVTEQPGAALNSSPAPIVLPLPSAEIEARVKEKIQQALARQAQARQGSAAAVSVRSSPDGLVISLREAGFFASGSAELRPEAMPTLEAVAAALPSQSMRVEGHTDDVPIHTPQFATNWELSTARAAAITRLLLARHATEPARIAAAGYAEFHPTASNATAAGRAENRRVDIILLADKTAATPTAPTPTAPTPNAPHAPEDIHSAPASAPPAAQPH